MADASLSVNAVENGTPQAIVILFGWLGSSPRHVQKYAKLYQDRNCSTIHGTADVMSVMLTQKEKLSDFGLEAAREALKLLKASEDSIPVIIQSFSGAGAVVLEQLELRIEEARAAKVATDQQKDLILLGEAIQRGGEFFDSCPAYLHLQKALKAIELAIPNVYLRVVIQFISIVVFILARVAEILRGEKMSRAEEHWSHMEESGVSSRQAYVYSTADVAIDHGKLEELIEHRKQRANAKVFVKKFRDGRHCAYLVKHAKEYEALLDEFLSSIQEQKKEEELLEQDPDMSDYQLGMD